MHRGHFTATVKRCAWASLLILAVVPRTSPGQTRVLVSEGDTGRPLQNAELINASANETLLTTVDGYAVIPARWGSSPTFRVRQVGYHFLDTTIVVPAAGTDPIAIRLHRIAYELPAVPVQAASGCDRAQDPANALVAATALDQLRMAAERYDVLRRQRPFRAHLERRTRMFDAEGNPGDDVVNQETTSSERWEEQYVPGRIIHTRRGGLFSVQLLFLPNLGDPEFWRWHCFRFAGMESLAERRVLRLIFVPVQSVRRPDWEGSVLLDSATSELLRVEFRLVRLGDRDRPRQLEGFTTFMSPTPNMVVPDSSVAIWWRDRPPVDAADRPDVLQLILLKRLEFRKRD